MVRNVNIQAVQEEQNLAITYRRLFRGGKGAVKEAGKDVISDLCYFSKSMMSAFSTDPLELARNEGRREVFYRIITLLEMDHSELLKIIDEQNRKAISEIEDVY